MLLLASSFCRLALASHRIAPSLHCPYCACLALYSKRVAAALLRPHYTRLSAPLLLTYIASPLHCFSATALSSSSTILSRYYALLLLLLRSARHNIILHLAPRIVPSDVLRLPRIASRHALPILQRLSRPYLYRSAYQSRLLTTLCGW